MAFVNMFNDRVEQFNLREENERLAELFSDEKLQEEAQWQAYSVKEISRLFSISEEEALKLMNCGLRECVNFKCVSCDLWATD